MKVYKSEQLQNKPKIKLTMHCLSASEGAHQLALSFFPDLVVYTVKESCIILMYKILFCKC